MAYIKKFEDMEVWQDARQFASLVHKFTLKSSFKENLALTRQIRRSSGSIMDNIAEGYDRGGNKEFVHFLSIAKASLAEVKSQLYRASDFGYLNQEEFEQSYNQADSIGKQIGGLIKYLKKSDYSGYKFKEPDQPYGND